MATRLDELCVRHDRTAARLHLVAPPAFARACEAMRHFIHLRDLMRLRLYVARGSPPAPSATRSGPLTAWPALARASKRFERLANRVPQE